MIPRNTALLRLLHELPSGEIADADWLKLGFRDPARVKADFQRLRSLPEFERVQCDMLYALAASCDPDQAFSLLEQWVDAGGQLQALTPQFVDLLCMLFAATPALSRYFIRFP